MTTPQHPNTPTPQHPLFKRMLELGPRFPFLRRKLLLLLAVVAILLVPLTPAWSWLLERAPDAFLQWEARWVPRDPRPDLVMGERLLALGQTRPALEHFERAASHGSADFRLAVAIADAMRAAGLYDKAATQAQELLRLEPASGRLHRILGQCRLEMGQLSEGLAALEKATRLAPHDVDAWIALAEARIGLEGFRPEIARVWEEGLRQNPGRDTLRYGLAETYAGLGRYEEAEALLKELPGEPVPDRPKPRELYARAWSAWGMVLHRLRPDPPRRVQARRALERALILAPRLPDTHYELGVLLAEDGEWEQARKSLETAVRLRPYAHPFWYHLARVYRQLKHRTEADQAERRFDLLVSTFSTVNRESAYLDAHPDDVARRLGLVRLLMARGDAEAAAAHLSLALRDHPRHPEASRLLQRLRGRRSRPSSDLEKPQRESAKEAKARKKDGLRGEGRKVWKRGRKTTGPNPGAEMGAAEGA